MADLTAIISDEQLATIAREFLTNWKELAPSLGLTRPQEESIRKTYRDYEDQKREALYTWKRNKGNGATFGAFIAAAKEISNMQLADNVRGVVNSQVPPPEDTSAVPPPEVTPLPSTQSFNQISAAGFEESRGITSPISPYSLTTSSFSDEALTAVGSEGSQGIAAPTSPPSSLTSSFSEIRTLSEAEVKERAGYLNTCFTEMVTDTQDALHESNANPRKVVNILRIPDAQFTYTPPKLFDSLKAAADILDLFGELDMYWDHFNYYLLEKIIMASRIEKLFANDLKGVYHNLKKRMKQYVEEMECFRRHTAIKVYCNAINQPKENVPEKFWKEIEECKSDLKTLQDIEEFRLKVAREYKLCECLVFCKNLKIGSIIITLWIPVCAELEVSVLSDDEGTPVDPFPYCDESQDKTYHPPDVSPDSGLTLQEPSQKEIPPKKGSSSLIKRSPATGSSVDPIPSRSKVALRYVTKTMMKYMTGFLRPTKKSNLTLAVGRGNIKEVSAMIEHGADPNEHKDWTPLKEAAARGYMDIAKLLLSKGADPNLVTDDWTPLMEASRVGNKDMAELLINNGADPNVVNGENWTALMAASNNGRYDVVDLLLKKGADPNMQDHVHWSALLASVYKCHDDIALRLNEAGADPHLQNIEGLSALRLAITNDNQERIVDAFLDQYPDVKLGLCGSLNLDLSDNYGETDLLFACKNRKLKIVEKLLRKGANPNLANKDGELPLLIAVGQGEKEMVEKLLQAGADPNLDCGIDLPLHLANGLGYEEIAESLKSCGADPHKIDKYSKNQLQDLLESTVSMLRMKLY